MWRYELGGCGLRECKCGGLRRTWLVSFEHCWKVWIVVFIIGNVVTVCMRGNYAIIHSYMYMYVCPLFTIYQ